MDNGHPKCLDLAARSNGTGDAEPATPRLAGAGPEMEEVSEAMGLALHTLRGAPWVSLQMAAVIRFAASLI